MRPQRPRTPFARSQPSGVPLPVGALNGVAGTAASPSPQPVGTTGSTNSIVKPNYRPPQNPNAQRTPNSGGRITANVGGQTQQVDVPADADYTGRQSTTANSGGIIQKGGKFAKFIPPDANYRGPTPSLSTPPNRPPQTERADPMTNGGGTPTLPGQSAPVVRPPTLDVGRAIGASSRGTATAPGQDLGSAGVQSDLAGVTAGVQKDLAGQPGQPGAIPGAGFTGGQGALTRNFTNRTAAGIYHDYVRQLFGQSIPNGMGGSDPTSNTGSSYAASPSGSSYLNETGDET